MVPGGNSGGEEVQHPRWGLWDVGEKSSPRSHSQQGCESGSKGRRLVVTPLPAYIWLPVPELCCWKESGTRMGTLRGRELQEEHQGLVLSFGNAHFLGVCLDFATVYPGRRWAKGGQGAQSWVCGCNLAVQSIWQHLNCSSLWEVDKKPYFRN